MWVWGTGGRSVLDAGVRKGRGVLDVGVGKGGVLDVGVGKGREECTRCRCGEGEGGVYSVWGWGREGRGILDEGLRKRILDGVYSMRVYGRGGVLDRRVTYRRGEGGGAGGGVGG